MKFGKNLDDLSKPDWRPHYIVRRPRALLAPPRSPTPARRGRNTLAAAAPVRQCASAPVRQCASAPVRQCASAPVRQCASAAGTGRKCGCAARRGAGAGVPCAAGGRSRGEGWRECDRERAADTERQRALAESDARRVRDKGPSVRQPHNALPSNHGGNASFDRNI
jgi:hypothetical protein